MKTNYKKMRYGTFILSIFTLWANAQKIDLVKDINQYPNMQSIPLGLTATKDKVFFSALHGLYGYKTSLIDQDQYVGRNLWITSGDSSSSRRIDELPTLPPFGDMYREYYTTVAADTFVFVIAYYQDSITIWRSNENNETSKIYTFPKINFPPISLPPVLASPTLIVGAAFLNKKLYFIKKDLGKLEFWSSDGTKEQTKKIKELDINADDISYQDLSIFKSKLIFKNKGVWVIDENGTTEMISSVNSRNMTISGDYFYFGTENPNTSIWKSDGTLAGTNEIFKGSRPRYEVKEIAVLNDEVYWLHYIDFGINIELRKSGNLNSYISLSDTSYFTDLTVFKNSLYFLNRNGLWKSDGTKESTRIFFPVDSFFVSEIGKSIAVSDKYLFFRHFGSRGLWSTDGVSVQYISNQKFDFLSTISFKGNLYFEGDDGDRGLELWKSDGTSNGTQLVVDANKYNFASSPRFFQQINNKIFLVSGSSIYTTDGTMSGTKFVSSSKLTEVLASLTLNNKIVLFSNNEIAVFDGTESGIAKILSLENPSTIPTADKSLRPFVFKNNIYFFVSKGGYSSELWKTDGTVSGTRLFKKFTDDSFIAFTSQVHNDNYFYVCRVTQTSNEMWESDGTSEGTIKKMQIGGVNPVLFNNKIILHASKQDGRNELQVIDLNTLKIDTLDVNGVIMSLHDDYFLFAGYKYEGRSDRASVPFTLHRSDGTMAGTYQIKDIMPNYDLGRDNDNAVLKTNNKTYFSYNNSNGVSEIWESGGTEETTKLLVPVGVNISSTSFLWSFKNTIFYAAYGGVWKIDETNKSAQLIKKNFGIGLGDTRNSIIFENQMFFAAFDGNNSLVNTELFKLYFEDCQPICVPIIVIKQK